MCVHRLPHCVRTHTHTCRFQFRFPTRENTSYTNGHPSFLAWLLSLCSVSWLSHLLLEARFLFTTEEKCLYHPGAVHWLNSPCWALRVIPGTHWNQSSPLIGSILILLGAGQLTSDHPNTVGSVTVEQRGPETVDEIQTKYKEEHGAKHCGGWVPRMGSVWEGIFPGRYPRETPG